MALLNCSCGTTCRVPSLPKGKMRCGKCKHIFTPWELTKAVPEPPPARPQFGGDLDNATDDEGVFCSGCGEPLVQLSDRYQCSNCGTEYDLD